MFAAVLLAAVPALAAETTAAFYRVTSPDGSALAEFRVESAPYKPYVRQLFTPAGLGVLDDSPPDHFHHHGLMLAIGAGDTDFWSEKGFPKVGRQEADPAAPAARLRDGVRQALIWMGHDGQPLLRERREVRVETGRDPAATWVRWRSELVPAGTGATVKLWGRHYFGLGMRFGPGCATAAVFRAGGSATGLVVRGEERLTPGPWCAMRGMAGGKPVTVVAFDRPSNPRPAVWFTMPVPFAYLAATLDLEKNPAELPRGEAWTLDYDVAVLDGHASEADLARLAETQRARAAGK